MSFIFNLLFANFKSVFCLFSEGFCLKSSINSGLSTFLFSFLSPLFQVLVYIFVTCDLYFCREEELGGFRKEFHIFFVPRKSLLCEKQLKVRHQIGLCNIMLCFVHIEFHCLSWKASPFEPNANSNGI